MQDRKEIYINLRQLCKVLGGFPFPNNISRMRNFLKETIPEAFNNGLKFNNKTGTRYAIPLDLINQFLESKNQPIIKYIDNEYKLIK